MPKRKEFLTIDIVLVLGHLTGNFFKLFSLFKSYPSEKYQQTNEQSKTVKRPREGKSCQNVDCVRPELVGVDMSVCPRPGHPRLWVAPRLAVEDEVTSHQRHGDSSRLLDEVRRLVDTESHPGRLSQPGNVLRLALVLPVVRLSDGADDEAAPLQSGAGALSQGQQAAVLHPARAGWGETLRGLAGDHDGGAHSHVHI